ncbi:MAG: peptide-methionine (S)-S-oxide reductase MsrA, partial [Beijerinckiaceae bacterium]|nr:peptide-methionine (S)-S-oxide reductase MsrA [Beijerinckiaceae bacterium]
MFSFLKRSNLPSPGEALPGRPDPIPTAETHYVTKRLLQGPYPDGTERAYFGMGCFWGAERKFWQMGRERIWITAVGYAAGQTPNPTYEEVCSGHTGHNEVVMVVFDPSATPYEDLLKTFWENHDPTQGMRQGND